MKKFINLNLSEEEQEEKIKNWFKKNIWQIVLGIALGFSSLIGWNIYTDYQQARQVEARSLYLNVMNNPYNLEAYNILLDKHKRSNYTKNAKFIIVKEMFDNQEYDSAIELIQPLTKDKDENIQTVAIFRLANIYLEKEDYDKALQTLDILENENYLGLYNSIKGDIYFSSGDLENAKKYYQLSIDYAKDNTFKELIRTKLNDIK